MTSSKNRGVGGVGGVAIVRWGGEKVCGGGLEGAVGGGRGEGILGGGRRGRG